MGLTAESLPKGERCLCLSQSRMHRNTKAEDNGSHVDHRQFPDLIKFPALMPFRKVPVWKGKAISAAIYKNHPWEQTTSHCRQDASVMNRS